MHFLRYFFKALKPLKSILNAFEGNLGLSKQFFLPELGVYGTFIFFNTALGICCTFTHYRTFKNMTTIPQTASCHPLTAVLNTARNLLPCSLLFIFAFVMVEYFLQIVTMNVCSGETSEQSCARFRKNELALSLAVQI